MGKGCLAILTFIGGFVLGWCIALGIYLFQTEVLGEFDREGAGAMGTAFVFGPLLGVIVGVGLTIFVMTRARPKS